MSTRMIEETTAGIPQAFQIRKHERLLLLMVRNNALRRFNIRQKFKKEKK